MTVLAIRTDKPDAELYLYVSGKKLAEIKWRAHLKLAETLNSKIQEILNMLSISYDNLGGIAIYKGPGSFTGLRIGMSVANALAFSLGIPIVSKSGNNWLESSMEDLLKGKNEKIVAPKYGAPARVTKPKK